MDLKTRIIAEYERTRGTASQVSRALRCDYSYTANVLNVNCGGEGSRAGSAHREADGAHLAACLRAGGFPWKEAAHARR